MLFGGVPQHTNIDQYSSSSISFQSDDYTWCVQRAKYLPLLISTVWILVVGLGYVNGLILYFLVSFDSKRENRNLDLHYTTYLISLPAWIGFSQRFHPKNWSLKVYYYTTVLFGMFFFAIALNLLIKYGTQRILSYQVHQIVELIDMRYKLSGTANVLQHIRKQETVCRRKNYSTILDRWTHFIPFTVSTGTD